MVDFNLGVPKDRWFPHWGRIAMGSGGRGRIAEQSSRWGRTEGTHKSMALSL